MASEAHRLIVFHSKDTSFQILSRKWSKRTILALIHPQNFLFSSINHPNVLLIPNSHSWHNQSWLKTYPPLSLSKNAFTNKLELCLSTNWLIATSNCAMNLKKGLHVIKVKIDVAVFLFTGSSDNLKPVSVILPWRDPQPRACPERYNDCFFSRDHRICVCEQL